ncbi:MAG: hypothetical protein NTY35_09930 [Planctomycetota bacterium]|nr:hypothetical protein [Planctomycetota bacterium]
MSAILLAAAVLVFGASAQRGAPEKGAQREKPASPSASVEAASGGQKGQAPSSVQLGEPVQPTEVQTREGGRVETDPRAKQRTVVRMMVNVERAHRDRVARLERLRAIFEASGATEKLATVARLRDVEWNRYSAALKGYERDLGPELYPQVRAAIDAGAGTPLALPPASMNFSGRAAGRNTRPRPPTPVPPATDAAGKGSSQDPK